MIKKIFTLTVVFTLLAIALVLNMTVSAANASDWQAGRIIDDSIYFKGSAMSESDIQSFLVSQMPTCDTWGQKMYSSTQTRAQRGTSKGVPPPYVCLKDYQENPSSKANNLTTAGAIDGGWSAAKIIKNASDTYDVNPKALIVLLHKEQGLVTDDWPWPGQYRSATGYGCPDTAPCDAQFYGFYNQVMNAAAAFKRYANNPQNYRYKAFQDNYILYSPNSACGSSKVYIDTQASAGLYIYTPYQPNKAALDNLYGTGDDCSAYGNRNFWRMFTDWFGTTRSDSNPSITLSSPLVINDGQPVYSGQQTTVKFSITNRASIAQSTGTVGVAGRDSAGNNLDIGYDTIIIPAKTTFNVSWNFIAPPKPGTVNYTISSNIPGLGWNSVYPTADTSVSRSTSVNYLLNPVLASGIRLDTSTPRVGVPVTASFAVKNNAPLNSVNIGLIGISVRSPNGDNLDLGWEAPTILSQSTYTYTKTFTFPKIGVFSASIGNYQQSLGWNDTFPQATDSSLTKKVTWNVINNLAVTENLSVSPSNPHVGEPVTFSYKITNFSSSTVDLGKTGVAMRSPSGANEDVAWINAVLPPNSSYTYSQKYIYQVPGKHTASIGNYRSNVGWSNFPGPDPNISNTLNIDVSPNPLISTGISLSSSSLIKVGQSYIASFSITNYSPETIPIGRVGIALRDPNGNNADIGWDDVTLQPLQTYTYSKPVTLRIAGTYKASIGNYTTAAGWNDTYPASLGNITRNTTWQVSN